MARQSRTKAANDAAIPDEAKHLTAVSPNQARAITGLSARKIYSLISSGELPSIRVSSRCRRILLRDLEAFLEQRREGGA